MKAASVRVTMIRRDRWFRLDAGHYVCAAREPALRLAAAEKQLGHARARRRRCVAELAEARRVEADLAASGLVTPL